MKRSLVLSILASVALAMLSGCGVVSSNASPEVYRAAIQSKARTLATQNVQYYGQTGFSQGGDIGSQYYGSYPDLWNAVINYLQTYVAYNDISVQSYQELVALEVRWLIATSRYASPSQNLALTYGGLGNVNFGYLQATYPGAYSYWQNGLGGVQGSGANSWYATYLGGTFTGGGNW